MVTNVTCANVIVLVFVFLNSIKILLINNIILFSGIITQYVKCSDSSELLDGILCNRQVKKIIVFEMFNLYVKFPWTVQRIRS